MHSLKLAVTMGLILSSPGLGAEIPTSGAPPRVGGWRAVTLAQGISHPWAIDWLSDGRALITARAGALYLFDGRRLRRVPMDPLPGLYVENQGGLLDISVRPRAGGDPYVYFTLSTGNRGANRTTLIRGLFRNDRVTAFETLFRVRPDKGSNHHFGSRLLWLGDGTLLMSIGDGGNPPVRIGGMPARDQAQNKASHLGSVLRLTADGKPVANNPFAGQAGARPELWSVGHRNIQGMTRDAATGRVWATEHGPRGGDELNLIRGGLNYGWPRQSYGADYQTLEPIGQKSVPGMADPLVAWVPSPAPSGLAYYSGPHFPRWRGSLFSGGLVSQDLRRIVLSASGRALRQERLVIGERVRDVRQGPDGYLYVLTDEPNGRLLRIVPAGP